MKSILQVNIGMIIQCFAVLMMILIWSVSPISNSQSDTFDYNPSEEYRSDDDEDDDDEDDDDEDDDNEDDDDEDDDDEDDDEDDNDEVSRRESDTQSKISLKNPIIKFFILFLIFIIMATGYPSPSEQKIIQSEEE